MNSTTIAARPTGATPSPRGRVSALLDRHGQFLLYACIGVGALAIDVSIFALLAVGLEWHPLIANTVSTLIAAIASFLANSFVNFKVTDRLFVRFVSFGVVAGIGWAVSSLIVGVGTGVFALDPLVAKGLSLPLVLILQFTLNKTITFRSRLGRTAS